MVEQRKDRRQPRPIRSAMTPAAALIATVVLLAACGGGGGGGGGGDTGHTLHAVVVNASAADVTVTYVGATPTDDVVLATCSAELLDFPLSDPFQLQVDGEAVIDSDVDLPDGLPNALDGGSDIIVTVTVDKEGAATFDSIRPGSGLSKPSKASYCPSLPG